MSGNSSGGSYRVPDLDTTDRIHLSRLERVHGRDRVIGWLRAKVGIPLQHQFDDGFDDDDYYETLADCYLNTETSQ